jgi:hypothetical protein
MNLSLLGLPTIWLLPARDSTNLVPLMMVKGSRFLSQSGSVRRRRRHSEGAPARCPRNEGQDLQSAVSWVGAHVLPVAPMTADEVTGPAHLAAFGAICRSGVMMSFGSRESAIAAATPASLCDPQSDSLGRVLRAGPRVMPCSSARSAAPLRRRIERASQECNEASSTRCPQERLPIDAPLARNWRRRPVYGLLVRKDLIGIH